MFILSWSWPDMIMSIFPVKEIAVLSWSWQYVYLVMELAIYDYAFPVKEIAVC